MVLYRYIRPIDHTGSAIAYIPVSPHAAPAHNPPYGHAAACPGPGSCAENASSRQATQPTTPPIAFPSGYERKRLTK